MGWPEGSALFLNAERKWGEKALPLECHTDTAVLFFMVDLAQLVQT